MAPMACSRTPKWHDAAAGLVRFERFGVGECGFGRGREIAGAAD